MIPGFAADDIATQRDGIVVYRKGRVVGLELDGPIDDRQSNLWRNDLEVEVMRGGFAEFYVVEGARMLVDNSIGSRFRSALFVRTLMQHARGAAIHSKGVKNPTKAMRWLLNVAGAGNVQLYHDEGDFARAVMGILEGTWTVLR